MPSSTAKKTVTKPKHVNLKLADRDALVAKLAQAEQMFLGSFPAAAKPLIAEVREALKRL